MIGERWLQARVAQISALRPDIIVLGGDILEGDSPSERRLLPAFARLAAPLGVWAVPGNHDRFGGGGMLEELERHGVRVLRNEWRELRPGLTLAGIDGGRVRRPAGEGRPVGGGPAGGGPIAGAAADRFAQALSGRPEGAATILLSHYPARVEEAARAGVALMLSGHTHDGQILAVPLRGPDPVPVPGRPLRRRRHAAHRLEGRGDVGPAHAPLAPWRNPARQAASGVAAAPSPRRCRPKLSPGLIISGTR